MSKFAIIGAAGYVAPRHIKAIQETGGTLCAVLDPSDRLGHLDACSFETEVFHKETEFEAWIRAYPVDYIAICAPNYLHSQMCQWAMRQGADVICEKPLALNPADLDIMQEIEEQTGRRVYTVLQLRLHPMIDQIMRFTPDDPFVGTLNYITPRGRWYWKSWKGIADQSGGILFNIGIHMFDMLGYLFGEVDKAILYSNNNETAAGYIKFSEGAHIDWTLSTSPARKPCRSLSIGDLDFNFTEGFTNLHTEVYRRIMSGQGFGIEDARQAVELAYRLKQQGW